MRFFRITLLSFCVAVLLGSCGDPWGGCRAPWLADDQFLGSAAPNFSLPNLEGQTVELATVSDTKPTLLVFWATWCPTCNEEIPVLNKWLELYPGLQILAINVQEDPERVRSFARKKKIRYPVLLDEKGEVAELYGLVGIPASLLLSKGGKILYYGFSLPQNVERFIQS